MTFSLAVRDDSVPSWFGTRHHVSSMIRGYHGAMTPQGAQDRIETMD